MELIKVRYKNWSIKPVSRKQLILIVQKLEKKRKKKFIKSSLIESLWAQSPAKNDYIFLE